MSIKKQNILITGAAGFIGSNLVDRLIDDNTIIAVDNFNDYYDVKIKEENIKAHLDKPNFKLYKTDICDFKELKKVFDENNIDYVVHLAARAGVRPSLENPELYIKTNINGTVNLLELVKNINVKKFVLGSSSSVYGAILNENKPFDEEMRTDRPISPYAVTKIAAERMCYAYSYLYGMSTVCLRFFTVYGPRQRPDLAIHKFARLISENKPIPLYGDGLTKRDYTYIDDIINGIISGMAYKNTPYEIINLGCGSPVSLNHLVELLGQSLNKEIIIEKLPLQAGDVPLTYANIEKARKLLDYKPSTCIKSGLEKFVEWMKKGVIAQ